TVLDYMNKLTNNHPKKIKEYFSKQILDTDTMQNGIHEYFSRKSSDWGILSFLDESNIEPFDKKIDTYIKSLNNIIASEQCGKRPEKARILLKMYKEA
ncbi:2664_t:CDS:2, partial [Cetraspora pellucida]